MTTITLPRATVEQALEALEYENSWHEFFKVRPYASTIDAITALRAALAQQAEAAQEQDVEDAIEAAYWQFDCRKNGINEWASAPQSERDAFKAEARKLVRGYFPTRQAQDTKREMLAVADAFIRGKRAALAQQDEPVQVAERERIASQWEGCVTHQLDTFGPVDIGASIRTGELVEAQQAEPVGPVAALIAQRDALLKALRYIDAEFRKHGRQHWPEAVRARAAIAAVEGEKA